MRQMPSMSPVESAPPKKETRRLSLEKTVRERIVFQDIDPSRPEQAYHEDMLRGLLAPGDEKQSLARRVLDRKGFDKKELERVIVESVVADDISKGVGYKRDVDRFTFAFSDGREIVFTVSLDKDAQDHADDSASLAESRALMQAKPLEQEGEYSAIQEFYGTAILKDANIIIDESADRLTARLCDVEYVRPDPEGVALELRRLRKIFGAHASAFENGFSETLKRLDGKEWMVYAQAA